MKTWLIGALAVAVFATAVPSLSEAKRLGGGKNAGMQRDMPARTAPDSTPAKPATPAQPGTQPGGAPGTPAAAPAAAGATAAAAAAGKKSWLGPIAGIAAGLGLVALMSHLGLGEEFANFLMLALLAVAVIALVMFLMRRFAAKKAMPAMAGAGAGGRSPTQVAWPQQNAPMERQALDTGNAASGSAGAAVAPGVTDPVPGLVATPPAATEAPVRSVPKAFVPASFDTEAFTRTAKMIFIRLQAANDTADLDDLRRFTTPELFASLRLDIQDRGTGAQHTDVQKVDAEVLDVAQEDGQQIVSVRFTGLMVEEAGQPATAFDEVWHLVKPLDDSKPWAIAGIEQGR